MKGDTVKGLYERTPHSVKRILAPALTSGLIRHPEFRRTWNDISSYDEMTAPEKDNVRLNRLKTALTYAYQNVPFYRRRFDDYGFKPEDLRTLTDIESLPILEKSEAISAGDDLYSCEDRLKYYKSFTGGSSGQTLTILLDKQSVYRERAFACYSYAKYGFDPLKDRTAAFWGHNKGGDFYYSPLKNEIVISPFRIHREATAAKIVSDIRKFDASYLAGYPSAIFQLVQMMDAENLKIDIKHIFYYAENCEPDRQFYVDQYLGTTSSSNYGHSEHTVFAEVNENGCVFNDLYGYTELVPTSDKDEFRIVSTGLTSRKMPLIRYGTDDVVRIGSDGIARIIGHKQSDIVLVGKNGAKIFKGAMTLHVPELRKIRAYQYFQQTPGLAELRIVEATHLDDIEIARIQEYLNLRTEGQLNISIRIVDHVVSTSRGKAIWAIVER